MGKRKRDTSELAGPSKRLLKDDTREEAREHESLDLDSCRSADRSGQRPGPSSSPALGFSGSSHEPAEYGRLKEAEAGPRLGWKQWGPYLSERMWGTVREDHSKDGSCWEHFPHADAAWRAYQWGEDGLMGVSDDQCQLCLALALWNGKDPILKERLYGLTGPQGNHGEDVKECYFYLDSTPTHSYMKGMYKYPQDAFPYDQLLERNTCRAGLDDPEFELLDTGVFDESRYFDVVAEYAKNSPCDVLCRFTVHNRSSQAATVHVLPTLWFRNTWASGAGVEGAVKPRLSMDGPRKVLCASPQLGKYQFAVEDADGGGTPVMLFTENDTNPARHHLTTPSKATSSNQATPSSHATPSSPSQYYKDAFHHYVIEGSHESVNPKNRGTKCAAHYKFIIPAQGHVTIKCRLYSKDAGHCMNCIFGKEFDDIFNQRIKEADEFYEKMIPSPLSVQEKRVARQAFAGLCWSKQFYYFDGNSHVVGDACVYAFDLEGKELVRNREWQHMLNKDVISMPDKWEFPWYATWDLAFHMVPYALLDVEFAKQQLLLLLSERYMHPNGQLPAYEFNFSDVNPPVHAWACFKVYKNSGTPGSRDTGFLKKCFHKLLLNFNWWVNRKDRQGKHVFHGGFLGMDNVSCVNRTQPPEGTTLKQVDGTAWMAFYCLCMLEIALELAQKDEAYEDMAIKFLDHYTHITVAIHGGQSDQGLWDEETGFYYDQLVDRDGQSHVLRVRSMVGLVALFPVYVLERQTYEQLPGFTRKLHEFLVRRKSDAARFRDQPEGGRLLLSVPSLAQLRSVLAYLLDETEFLSPHGIRSLSKYHRDHPFSLQLGADTHSITYCPGESNCAMFGGNSNWRGPVWLCMNYLLIESLERYDYYYGESLRMEMPTGSGNTLQLCDITAELRSRLVQLFLPDKNGRRPCHGDDRVFAVDPQWRDLLLFHEFFHGDTGRGCGASHQTGWTGLIVCLLKRMADTRGGT